ncbi:MAG: hypothetical protein HFI35_01115 [Roseburia sp.]|nr:hypothetical protein [Roseburia sp.]
MKEAHTKTFEQISIHRMEDFYLTSENPDLNIHTVTVQPTGQMQRILTFLCLCLCFLLDAIVWIRKKGLWSGLSFWQKNAVWGICLIGIASSVPLFTNYLLNGADLSFHLMRIEGLAAGLREGSFPVKLQPLWINDYRYPVSVLYGDLLLYPAALLRLIGFPLQTVYKCYVFLINMLTCVISYFCGKKISGSIPSALAISMMYTFAGYRITNVYLWAAAGAATSLALLPIVFLGLWMMLGNEKQKTGTGIRPELLLVIGYTGVLQSHTLGFEIAILFSVIFCMFYPRSFLRKLPALIGTAVVTILLNLGFLVPMLHYMLRQDLHVFHVTPENLQQTGLFVPQIFQMFTFYTQNKASGSLSPVSYGIGNEFLMGAGMAVSVVLILYLWMKTVRNDRLRRQFPEETGSSDRMAWLTMLCMIMTCYAFPWSALADLPFIGRVFSVFQFATRFTMPALVFGLMLAAFVLKFAKGIFGSAVWKCMLAGLCLIALAGGIYQLEMVIAQGNPIKVTCAAGLDTRTAVSSGEYVPEGTYSVLLNNPNPEAEDGVIVSNYQKTNGVITFWAENTLEKEGYIKVPFLAYKGYHAVDMETGRELYLGNGNQNVILIIVPSGYSGAVKVYFKEPMIWRVAEMISLITLIGIISGVWIFRKKAGLTIRNAFKNGR